MKKSEQSLYILLCTISSLLLISKNDFLLFDFGLIFLSLPLLRRPVTYIPLLFVASWNQSFGVLGLGAFYYYFLLFLVSLFFSRKSDVKFVGSSFSTRIYICFASWIIFTMFTSVSHEMSYPIKLSITIVLVFLASNFKFKDSDYCNKCMLWVSFAASFFFFYRAAFSPVEFSIERFNSWGAETVIYQSILDGVNPNSASPIVTFLTLILIIECIKRHIFLYFIPCIMNLYTMIFLGSRTPFYTLFIVITFYFFFIAQFSIKAKIGVLISAIFISALTLYFINSMETHLADSIVEDEGNGRFVTWALLATTVIPNYWLFGIGVGRGNYDALGYGFDADNLYFDLLCQIGVVGFVLFFYIFFSTLWKAYQSSKTNTSIEIVFLILMAFPFLGIGESVFDSLFFWGTLLYSNSIIEIEKSSCYSKHVIVENHKK